MRSRAAARLTCALALALALPGCGDRSAARNGGTAVMAVTGDLDFANPLVSTERWTQEINRFMLFLPLVEYGPKLEVRPRLAERWELLGDTGVVFHLRRGVRWSDGVPVT
ncbi:MAG TPA: hypothetical protein VFQ38_11390, partial [Longimicrobiales bacterium]|nr:hypothetical protein [Longimicrobiales bacterium]